MTPTSIPISAPKLTVDQILSISSFVALVPIFVASVLFFIVYFVERRAELCTPDTTCIGNSSSLPALEDKSQLVYLPINEQWWNNIEVSFNSKLPGAKPLDTSGDVLKKVQSVPKLIENGRLNEIRIIARQILVSNSKFWDDMLKNLHKARSSVIPLDAAEQAFVYLQTITIHDPSTLLLLSSDAIILYEILHPTMQTKSLRAADIAYNLGYAYSCLSTTTPYTCSYLLQLAIKKYQKSLQVYKDRKMLLQQKKTLDSLGNAYIALSKISSKQSRRNFRKGKKYFHQLEHL